MKRRKQQSHVRDMFDPDSKVQTSLFADCAPTLPIVCTGSAGEVFPVLAEVERKRLESVRRDEEFERMAAELEADRLDYEKLTGRKQSAAAWEYANEKGE